VKRMLVTLLLCLGCGGGGSSGDGGGPWDGGPDAADGFGVEDLVWDADVPPPMCGDSACTLGETCTSCPSDCGQCGGQNCGDGQCSGAETCFTCAQDCGKCCGDGTCGDGESCTNCVDDCGPCTGECGDGVCNPAEDETQMTCPADCGDAPGCGDGACADGETCATCAEDCGSCCGDGTCGDGESCTNCVDDCGPCGLDCGDGICGDGESCTNCVDDCGPCVGECGDGVCNPAEDETQITCPADCGGCGDGGCSGDETCSTCPQDCGPCAGVCGDGTCDPNESCSTCDQDCGKCPGEALCNVTGTKGDTFSCPVLLAASDKGGPLATGFQADFSFDAESLAFAYFHDEFCQAGGTCMDWDIPPQNILVPAGHTLAYQELSPGVIRVLVYHGSKPGEPVTNAWLEGGQVVGDALVVEIVFTLLQSIPAVPGLPVEVFGAKASDMNATPLEMTVQDGVLVTSP